MAEPRPLRPRPRAPPLRPRPQRRRRRRQTRKGEPLQPLDDPQPGRLRCASRRSRSSSVLAFDSGRRPLAPPPRWSSGLIAAGDYLDGFLARVTGQYSRMGALLDPLVDRLTILAGAVVCWHFELLPRWALALLALRELAMLVLAQYGLRHGVDIEVNWPGRISVFPIMGGIFLALVVAGWVPTRAADLAAWPWRSSPRCSTRGPASRAARARRRPAS